MMHKKSNARRATVADLCGISGRLKHFKDSKGFLSNHVLASCNRLPNIICLKVVLSYQEGSRTRDHCNECKSRDAL